jgi:branched-chain amino acid transport system ATP-binding protein
MLLEVDNITLRYGRIEALHGLTLRVAEGEVVALIGANGAGKTTTMRAISGLNPLASGKIRFDGKDISNMRADLRVPLGICQSPEGRGIFPGRSGQGPGPGAHPLPAAGRAAQAGRRHAVGR